MSLRRNIIANALLNDTLSMRFRSKRQSKSDRFRQIDDINKKYTNKNKVDPIFNIKTEKQLILEGYDKKGINKNFRRVGFSPYDESSVIIDDNGNDNICEIFNTGFEDDCDYLNTLYQLNDAIMLAVDFEDSDSNELNNIHEIQ
jgi:hypothetical protein